MTLTEKVAYIRGLAEGLELDEDKKEVKVLNAILDLLDDLTGSVSDLEDVVDDMEGQLDEVDEDLGAVEKLVYGIDEDEEEELAHHHGCGCGCEDDEEDDETYYEVTCPNCHETICLTEDLVLELEGDIARYQDAPVPAILLIPGGKGLLGVGMGALRAAAVRAVGLDILGDKQAVERGAGEWGT